MMSSLGVTLKDARKNIGLTLMQVESMVGISNAYLSQLENDKFLNRFSHSSAIQDSFFN